MTVFLSYGQRDADEIAAKLCADLKRRGIDVWHDIERIRTGYSWSEEIEDGLKASQVLVALLSPHAVRRNKDSV